MAIWSTGGVQRLGPAAGFNSTTNQRQCPWACSPVTRNAYFDGLVAQDSSTVRSVRHYLASVYPMGRFLDASKVSALDAVRVFRSRHWLYKTSELSSQVPLDALAPDIFTAGSTISEVMRCSDEGQPLENGAIHRLDVYEDLLPCRFGVDCAKALSRFAPDWLDGVEQLGGDTYFEVRHFSHISWWFGNSIPPDPLLHPPWSWLDFEDYPRVHGSAWWFMHAPGSGIFYHAGRTLTAPTKIAMFKRLLELWLVVDWTAWPELNEELRQVASGDQHGFLAKVKAVESGEQSCRMAGLPHCYDMLDGGSLYVDSWTLYDEPYDDLSIRMGRALGFDTLFFSASFLRPDIQRGSQPRMNATFAGAEMVDLRRPSWAQKPNSETADAWASASASQRADSWAEDMRRRGTLSLRDPLAPARPGMPCDFALTHQLACKGHPSWALRDQTPAHVLCGTPQH